MFGTHDFAIFLVAGITLAIVTLAQSIALGLWLWLREPGQITATLGSWRRSTLVGVFSLIGSWCWFAAFALQNAAYVFAVGQIELIFSLAVGVLLFREQPAARELSEDVKPLPGAPLLVSPGQLGERARGPAVGPASRARGGDGGGGRADGSGRRADGGVRRGRSGRWPGRQGEGRGERG